ncbi:Uma2 family endonuclease [Prochlorothrix hollandica]|uniref:Uma2 family endonuclease n=1 Tax=Prochlorothrix hollandica TaxID=1223 RepID=UPI0033423928
MSSGLVTLSPPLTLEQYLAQVWDDDRPRELIAGVPTPMPPESWRNAQISTRLLLELARFVAPNQLSHKDVELAVSGYRAQTRIPDLMVLSPQLAAVLQGQSRAIIVQDMPPPLLVVEVVSPGKENADRDYRYKRSEYAARCIAEYWIVDPQREQITVLQWVDGFYEAMVRSGTDALTSAVIPDFDLTVAQILNP